ncbi:MAG: serpin family protein [Bacteroidia bacterium]
MKTQSSNSPLYTVRPPQVAGRIIFVLFLLVLASPAFSSRCFASATPSTANQSVVNANNALAFKLYRQLTKPQSQQGKGQFFSPFSIFVALSMTSEGLQGKSLETLRTAMELPDEATLHAGLMEIGKSLNAKDLPYAMALANAIWPDAGTKLQPKFLETIREIYLGESKPLDYQNDAEASRKTINDWVEKLTRERIKNLLPAGSIDADTRMVLTNAIYFKGSWAQEFDKTLTLDQPFLRDGLAPVKVPLMYRPAGETHLQYVELDGTQILELPYKGDDLSMVIMLPESGKIGTLESSLNATEWNNVRKSMSPQLVDVRLPRFKMTLGGSIREQLIGIGLSSLFEAGDFSRMFVDGGGYTVSDVYHKAFVEVNEEGTEAAAATAVVVVCADAMPREEVIIDFRADHPFIFMIQQRSTGNILFMGKVTDPSATAA